MTGDEGGAGWFVAVVFDLDGLLVDSEPLWRLAEIEVFGRYGVPLTDDLCRTTKGRFIGDVARHWYDRFGWAGPAPATVADEVVDRMAELLAGRAALKPGARLALDWCRQAGLRLAVASSSSHRLIDAALGRHDLRTLFDAVCSAEDVGAGKPDPAVYLAAAGSLGVPAERCLAVEDAVLGARAALAAGMGCLLVPEADAPQRGAASQPPGAAGQPPDIAVMVDGVLASLGELPAAWDRVVAHFLARHRPAG